MNAGGACATGPAVPKMTSITAIPLHSSVEGYPGPGLDERIKASLNPLSGRGYPPMLPTSTLTTLIASLLLLQAATPASAQPVSKVEIAAQGVVESSVVKVFSTLRMPDVTKPWTKSEPSEATGSGVVIEGRRILTNAHVVLYASQVQVQAHQTGNKVQATVEAIAPGIDLAVLKLEDESLFESHKPLQRAGGLPDVKDAVMVFGYPTGGSNLSITKGIVSRIEFSLYNFPVSGLRVQIDAAINPGNSGGPAVVGEKMVGLAFSRLGGGAQNIGYIIPNEEIELFLNDIADGKYDGKPALFDDLQTLENPALRAFLKLDKAVQGIVVNRPHTAATGNPLQRWDLITHIGDAAVDDQGMVKLGPNLRVRFQYLAQRLAKDGLVPLKVLRAGKTLALSVPAPKEFPVMVPDLQGAYPSYFVYGPLVFSRASLQFLMGAGRSIMGSPSQTASPLMTRVLEPPAFPGEELVVVASPFLPHKLATGYSSAFGQVLKTVNGVPVKNLRHLVEVLRDSKEEFLSLEFARKGGEIPVFPRREMEAATEGLLTDNGIRSQGTPELMKVWNTKAGSTP
jgi:S1-C subfamily serine protease